MYILVSSQLGKGRFASAECSFLVQFARLTNTNKCSIVMLYQKYPHMLLDLLKNVEKCYIMLIVFQCKDRVCGGNSKWIMPH